MSEVHVSQSSIAKTFAIPPAPQLSLRSPLLTVEDARDLIQNMTGRLKTLADAMIADPRQCKAFKDIIHDIMWADHWQPIVVWYEGLAHRAESHPDVHSSDNGFPFRRSHQAPEANTL